MGFDWTPDGHLLIAAGEKLVRMRPDGTDPVVLFSDPLGYIKDVTSYDHGRSLAVTWLFHGGEKSWKVWRAKSDGSDAASATPGSSGAILWFASPDGKFLYYSDYAKSSGAAMTHPGVGPRQTWRLPPGSNVESSASSS